MAKTPRYEDEPAEEPKAKLKAEEKATPAPQAEDTANPPQLQPYPEGSPQDPTGREVFKQAHGYYPEDFPPAGTPPPTEPIVEDTRSSRKDK